MEWQKSSTRLMEEARMAVKADITAALQRNITSSDGYIRYQISRKCLNQIEALIARDPQEMLDLIQRCLDERGPDNRRK